MLVIDPELHGFFHITVGDIPKGILSVDLKFGCHIDEDFSIIIFVLKPKVELVEIIADFAKRLTKEPKIYVLFWPRYTIACKTILENEGVIKKVIINEIPCELLPIENDMLSLEEDSSFRGLFLGEDFSSLTLAKWSIKRLEALYGRIPVKCALGPWSCMIRNALEIGDKNNIFRADNQFKIDGLILIDRTIDLITPLLSQATYEGIIDDCFTLKSGQTSVQRKIAEIDPKNPDDIIPLYLTSKDDLLFASARNVHINVAQEFIKSKYEELDKSDDIGHYINKEYRTIAEMRKYKQQSQDMADLHVKAERNQKLRFYFDSLLNSNDLGQQFRYEHMILFNSKERAKVMNELELEISKCKENDREKILRLMCLASLIGNGLEKEKYVSLTNKFIYAFGNKEALRIMNLNKLGMLKIKSSGKTEKNNKSESWEHIKKEYELSIDEDIPPEYYRNPYDMYFAYSNYSPLSVRLIQRFIQNSWEISKGNSLLIIVEKITNEIKLSPDALSLLKGAAKINKRKKPVVLVYYIGGVTYAEVSCFRFLSFVSEVDYIVATTQFINGKRMINAFRDKYFIDS